jgi:F-type H+-transporting ATPase subunit b
MDKTLHALGEILLKAVPTFFLVLLLHQYLKRMFFKPLSAVLKQRYEATEGARQRAEQSLERAASKTKEYEEAMRAARAELYQAQDRLHKHLQEDQSAQVLAARQNAEAAVKQAKDGLAADVAVAQQTLAGESDRLANQIAETILRRSAA